MNFSPEEYWVLALSDDLWYRFKESPPPVSGPALEREVTAWVTREDVFPGLVEKLTGDPYCFLRKNGTQDVIDAFLKDRDPNGDRFHRYRPGLYHYKSRS